MISFCFSFSFAPSFAGALDTLAAQSFGAGSMEGVNLWTKRALLLVTLLTLPVMVLLAFGYPFLRYVLTQSEEISVDGAVYCQWLILGIWPQNMTVVLQKYLQSQESQSTTADARGCWGMGRPGRGGRALRGSSTEREFLSAARDTVAWHSFFLFFFNSFGIVSFSKLSDGVPQKLSCCS